MQLQSFLVSDKCIRRNSISTKISYKNNDVYIGNNMPIVIQSMTNTNTSDVDSTVKQILELVNAGSEIVRVAVNNQKSACAISKIREELDKRNILVPIVGDFHFNGHILLNNYPECAQALSKYRINPGNVNRSNKYNNQFAKIIEIACKYEKPVRIGVNWGSLDQNLLTQIIDKNIKKQTAINMHDIICITMVKSALNSAKMAEKIGLSSDKIVLSCKTSIINDLVTIYQSLAKRCKYALHLGLTEAGVGTRGIVASASALAILLRDGIGDTIRVSLTPSPGQSRAKEVIIAQEILQVLGIRNFTPVVTSCPGCGRTSSIEFQQLAFKIQNFLREKMPYWQTSHPGVTSMNVAVMGCIVNGPGESKYSNVGISLPGIGESNTAIVFIDGKKYTTLSGSGVNIAEKFQDILVDYVNNNY